MRRSVLLIAAFAVVAASCGGGSDTASTMSDSSDSPVTTSPVTTSPVTTSPATTSPATTSPPGVEAPTTTVAPVEGPAAPDFTLALGDGGDFTLSVEQKPVYLIFWAEW
jgi:hypothetical protein